jgi:1,4-dihydroxy-2-naphthoate octaprenyltransferase
MSKTWKLKWWLLEIRAPFFTASVVPVVLGAVIAWQRVGTFHWGWFLLTLVAAMAVHAGINIANDYFDHLSGNDPINVEFVSPFTGGSRLIQAGLLSPREVLMESLFFFALGSAIGLYLTWARGAVVLVLGLIGVLSGFFYTAPPIYLAKRGIGEFFVGLNCGFLITLGSYYVQTRSLAWEPVVAAIPVACLIAAVLWINEFQDAPADHAVGKDTLVVRLGRKRAVTGYIFLMATTYLSILLAVALRVISPFTLLALLTLPLAWKAIGVVRLHYDDYQRLTPANATTIQIHMLTGLLLILGYLLDKVI